LSRPASGGPGDPGRPGGRVLVTISAEELAGPYVEALKALGVPAERIAVLAPGESDPGDLRALAAGAAGLVLAGGADIDPARYGEEVLPHGRVEPLPARDALEWELLAGAQEARRPVWGVCRGLQVLNVFLGGSLWQDIPTQLPGTGSHEVSPPPDALAHGAKVVAPGSGLGRRLSREALFVNSRHHQAVRRLGEGLEIVATSPDGLVEAVELPRDEAGGWWVRAVQWHPENLMALAQQRVLWQDFLAAAGLDGAAGSPGDASA
jgi:putative glutamine amidotransferase